MPTQAQYEKTLDRLVDLLRDKPMTAREIAKAMKCCRPVVYERLDALEKRGTAVFKLTRFRIPGTGPKPIAYGVR